MLEAKRAEVSPKVGIPHALAYMLAAPAQASPLYGLATNGSDFVFLKLQSGLEPCYGKSQQFILDQDLQTVLQIAKALAQIVGED